MPDADCEKKVYLRVTGKNLDALTQQMQDICSSIESEVVLKSKDPRPKSPEVLPIESAVPPARKLTENNKTLIILCLGAALFIAGEILEHMGMTIPSLIALVIGYILLGGKVVLTAVKNLTKGQIFDENFLMTVAPIGALLLGEYSDAVIIMIVVAVNGIVGVVQEGKAQKALDSLKQMKKAAPRSWKP